MRHVLGLMRNRAFIVALFIIAAGNVVDGCGGGGGDGTGFPPPPTGTTTDTRTSTTSTSTGTGSLTGDPGDADRVDLIVVIYKSCPESEREWIAGRITGEFAPEVWRASEGNMYIGSVSLRIGDGTEGPVRQANIVFDPLEGYYVEYGSPGSGSTGWGMTNRMGLSGGCEIGAFMHEWGHAFMGRYGSNLAPGTPAEEYECTVCWMAAQGLGEAEGYCDESNCMVAAPCWEKAILRRHPNFKRHHQSGPSPAAVIHMD